MTLITLPFLVPFCATETVVANVPCSTIFKVNLFRCPQLSPNNALTFQSPLSLLQIWKILHLNLISPASKLAWGLYCTLYHKRDCRTMQLIFISYNFHVKTSMRGKVSMKLSALCRSTVGFLFFLQPYWIPRWWCIWC